jgi:hypothetical protein
MSRWVPLATGLTLALVVATPAVAQDAPEVSDGDAPLDPSADRLTLRPLALPHRMLELQANLIWTTGPRFTESTPIDTEVAARFTWNRTELHVGLNLHTRYATDDNRPKRLQWLTVGADYQISQRFVAGLELRNRHPFGGNVQQGFDVRMDVGGKWIVMPALAFVGYSGAAFQQRETAGQVGTPNAFQLVGDGAVQVAPIRHVTLEGLAAVRFNLSGDLYGDNTFLVDVGAAGTVNLVRQVDAYVSGVFVLVPTGIEDRIFTFGVKYRHP